MSGKETRSQIEAELDRARERLSFYEQFDEIIKQNISSSSALLKEASARFDSDFADERRRHRALLADILDDVTALQAQSERLARRVNDALDELENELPAGTEFVTAPIIPAIKTEAPPETAAIVDAATRKKPATTKSPAPSDTTATTPVSILPIEAPVVELPSTGSVSTTLLVHGVPRASAALGLKTYIEKLDFVSNIEPREFAAGLLRLQVDGTRTLAADDLAGWTMADRIELKNASKNLLEIDLTPV